jgi:hypothetical protein
MPDNDTCDDTSVNGAVSPSFHDEEESDWAGDCDAGFADGAEDEEEDEDE